MGRLPPAGLWILAAAALVAGPSHALYKVVGPDGKVTFSDRPMGQAGSTISTWSGPRPSAATEAQNSSLPADLRTAVAKFPVTLYTAPGCRPCDSARTLLTQRGIPYTELQVLNDDDAQALERVLGGRTLPGLTIGKQVLVGLSSSDWSGYLDAAGYPTQSRLPANWQRTAPAPLAPRGASAAATGTANAAAEERPQTPSTPPSGIRF